MIWRKRHLFRKTLNKNLSLLTKKVLEHDGRLIVRLFDPQFVTLNFGPAHKMIGGIIDSLSELVWGPQARTFLRHTFYRVEI